MQINDIQEDSLNVQNQNPVLTYKNRKVLLDYKKPESDPFQMFSNLPHSNYQKQLLIEKQSNQQLQQKSVQSTFKDLFDASFSQFSVDKCESPQITPRLTTTRLYFPNRS